MGPSRSPIQALLIGGEYLHILGHCILSPIQTLLIGGLRAWSYLGFANALLGFLWLYMVLAGRPKPIIWGFIGGSYIRTAIGHKLVCNRALGRGGCGGMFRLMWF